MDAQQTSLFNAILIGGGIVVVIIIYFLISIISHQRRNMVLQKAKILAEITTLETERQRVSADLHDELGPVLASVKFKMYSIDINSDKDAVTMEKLTEEVDEIIVRLREIANNLVPNTLLRKGLVDALTESVDKYNGTNNLQITFTPCKVPSLPQSSAINIYRIVLEIIHNAIKHSQATELLIKLVNPTDRELILQTRDNGIGFDAQSISMSSTGLGLRSLLSRTEILDAKMQIMSKQGMGTAYLFEIPI